MVATEELLLLDKCSSLSRLKGSVATKNDKALRSWSPRLSRLLTPALPALTAEGSAMFLQQRKRHRFNNHTSSAHQHLDDEGGAATLGYRAVRPRAEYASAAAALSQPSQPSEAAATSSLLIPAAHAVGDSATPVTAIVLSNSPALHNSAITVDSKRAYPCRFCGVSLSSSSNRLRHERAKHQPQLEGSSASVTEAAPAASASDVSGRRLELEVGEAAAAAQLTSDLPPKAPEPSHQLCMLSQQLGAASQPAAASSFVSQPAAGHMAMVLDVDAGEGVSSSSSSSSDNSDSDPDPAANAGTASDSAAQIEGTTSSAAPQQQPSLSMDLAGIEGVSPSLQEAELQAQCYPFLCWLTEPPLTPCEALVKARRIKSLSQLQPIKNTLRFIFVLLHEHRILEAPELRALSTLSVCQQLYNAMQARQAGHARLHAIFLLAKKILVFLSSKESATRRQFLLPSSVSESYLYVDGICSDSSFRRKQEARNRSLLGVAASRQLHHTQAAQSSAPGPAGFRVPQTWSTSAATTATASAAASERAMPLAHVNAQSSPQTKLQRVKTSFKSAARTSPSAPSSSAAVAQVATPANAAASAEGVSANEMSSAELQRVTQGCVQFLQQHSVQQIDISSNSSSAPSAGPASTLANGNAAAATQPEVRSSVDVLDAAANLKATAASSADVVTMARQPIGNESAPATALAIAACAAELAALPIMNDKAAPAAVPVADHVYMAYLVTALLCLCMAPRSQVLRQLQIGSSLVKESDGKYWVRLLADMCKNGKPTLFAVPELLTPVMDHYLKHVRPRMLARQPRAPGASGPALAAAAGSSQLTNPPLQLQQAHNYFFCKANGTAPRAEFSTCTSLVTMQLIGRPINAHAFRSAVITTFYSANASQADMDTLANIMSHDANTARNYYYRPAHMRAAEETAQRMMTQLLPIVEEQKCVEGQF